MTTISQYHDMKAKSDVHSCSRNEIIAVNNFTACPLYTDWTALGTHCIEGWVSPIFKGDRLTVEDEADRLGADN
jgi:hypothetical protein